VSLHAVLHYQSKSYNLKGVV